MCFAGRGGLESTWTGWFQAAFFQKMWNIVGDAVSSSVIRILDGQKLPQDMADALLVLIPKVERPENIKQLRPISLYNVSFKLVTKAIVNHLKPFMEELVSPNQSSFVPKRQQHHHMPGAYW